MAALKKQDCSPAHASAFRNNQHQAMAIDNTISQACTGIWLQQLGPRVNITEVHALIPEIPQGSFCIHMARNRRIHGMEEQSPNFRFTTSFYAVIFTAS